MNVICGHCGVTNRVDEERDPGAAPLCGKCGKKIEPEAPGYPINADHVSLADELSQTKVPVLLDLWGSHCPPCRQLAPTLKTLAKDLAGKVKIVKVNVEQNGMVAQAFQVRGVPTLILFQNKKEMARTSGAQPLENLKKFVQGVL